MPRLRSWADWYHAYPMPPEMVAENIKYTAVGVVKARDLAERTVERSVLHFNIKVRDLQAASK